MPANMPNPKWQAKPSAMGPPTGSGNVTVRIEGVYPGLGAGPH